MNRYDGIPRNILSRIGQLSDVRGGDVVADWSKALVRLVARLRMILRSWVRVLAEPWTVEPSNVSWAGTVVDLYKCEGLFVAL